MIVYGTNAPLRIILRIVACHVCLFSQMITEQQVRLRVMAPRYCSLSLVKVSPASSSIIQIWLVALTMNVKCGHASSLMLVKVI